MRLPPVRLPRLLMLMTAVAVLVCGLKPCTAPAQDAPQFRRLAPGVERTIPPHVTPQDVVAWQSVPSLLARQELKWQPNRASASRTLYAKAGNAEFRSEVWALQFTFKPLRMIYVDVPQPSGKLQRKLIWYMVYRVTNTGHRLRAEVDAEKTLSMAEGTPGPVRFIPHFVFETQEPAGKASKSYLDRVIPAAVGPIQRREDPARDLLTTVEIAGTTIPVSQEGTDQSLWGVVTWEDIDPYADFFSIYVAGLTNAVRWEDPAGGVQPGDPPGKGRVYLAKTLQLNFWRPGDEVREHENEIRFGLPKGMSGLYGVDEGVDYDWVYR